MGIRTRKIKVNGKKAQNNYHLSEKDVIAFYYNDECFKKTSQSDYNDRIDLNLNILFENEDVLIVNKNAGVLSQGDSSNEKSIVEMAKAYLHTNEASVVTRLDRNTSGIVIIGKNRRALMLLNEMSRKNLIEKEYVTLVKGKFNIDGKVTHYGKKVNNKLVLYDERKEDLMEVSSVFNAVKYINGYTLLKVRLITGRTHQIRSQIEKLGFSVVGDIKYDLHNKEKELEKKSGLKRQFLHCKKVIIKCENGYDELNDKNIKVTCKMSEDLLKCLNILNHK